jgi:hypothetical protein
VKEALPLFGSPAWRLRALRLVLRLLANCPLAPRRCNVAPGRFTTMLNPRQILAFAPWQPCPLWAESGHRVTYSITSSAAKRILFGRVMPSAGPRARGYFAAAGRQIACFSPLRNGASILAGSRREIADPSRSFTHLDRKDASRLFAATGSY